MCINKRVLAVVAALGVGLLMLSPQLLAGIAPLLVMAICPLSMVFMMRSMGRRAEDEAALEPTAGHQQRELEEEVNRLKAELALRSQGERA